MVERATDGAWMPFTDAFGDCVMGEVSAHSHAGCEFTDPDGVTLHVLRGDSPDSDPRPGPLPGGVK